MVLVPKAATSPKLQFKTPAVMVHAAPSTPPTVQFKPPLVGKVSVKVTERAIPGPALLTTMVKPIASPALTGEASLVLVTLRSGHCTCTLAVALLFAVSVAFSLVAVADALLETVPQFADVVVALT